VYSDTSTLLDTFELRGKWWLADRPHDRVHGTVTYSPQGIRLQLDGRFDRPEFNYPPVGMAVFRPECVLGDTVEGQHCTLYRTFVSHISATNASVVANALVVGEHLNTLSDFSISGALLHYTNLEEWTCVRAWRPEIGTDPSHFRVVIPTDSTRLFTIRDTEYFRELALIVGTQSSLTASDFTAKTRTHFVCDFLKPVRLPEVQGAVGQLANLLSLLKSEPTYATRVRLKISDLGPAPRTADLFYEPGVREHRVLRSHEMNLALKELSDDAMTLFSSWFMHERELAPIYDLLAGTIYNTQQNVFTTFLALAQAVESFHRRVHGGVYMSESTYAPIRDAICEAIPSNLEEDFQRRLKDAVKYGHQFSLRTRLKELLRMLKDRTVEAVVKEKPQGFVSLVVSVRNFLTHYDERNKPRIVDDPVGMYNLNQRLRGLLSVLILTHMGVPESKASDGIASHLDLVT
jgi:hypothetical protein